MRRVPVEVGAAGRQSVGIGAGAGEGRSKSHSLVQATLVAEPAKLGALVVLVSVQHGHHPGHERPFICRCVHAQEGYVQDPLSLDFVVDLKGEASVYELLDSLFLTQLPCLLTQLNIVNS